MGLYDRLDIEVGVELPGFTGDREAVDWQTKSIDFPRLRTFRLTADGRLLRKEVSHRELTDEELAAKARDHGYESWATWEQADSIGPLQGWRRTVDEEWWVDHHQHGTFSFRGSTPQSPLYLRGPFHEGRFERDRPYRYVHARNRGNTGLINHRSLSYLTPLKYTIPCILNS